MYSREEAKQIRQQFWTMFGKRYDRKWLLYNTKIKDIVLKFSFENSRALVSIDIMHDEKFYRDYFFEKIIALKVILMEEVSQDIILDANYVLESGKCISRAYIMLENVKIQKQTQWPDVYEFFYKHMDRLEHFFEEYRDIIES